MNGLWQRFRKKWRKKWASKNKPQTLNFDDVSEVKFVKKAVAFLKMLLLFLQNIFIQVIITSF